MESRDLEGKVALVTGAAQGLGLGIARELAQRGSKVLVTDLQLIKAKEECRNLQDRGMNVVAMHLDVTESGKVTDFFFRVRAT